MLDSHLAGSGPQQCISRSLKVALLHPQLVGVSSLFCTIQTLYLSFVDHCHCIPWFAHKGCREELDLPVCNK